MKKLIGYVCVAIVWFIAGYVTCYDVNDVEFLIEANDFKRELIDAQQEALLKVDEVIDNNNLLDTDGSDTMMEYLEKVEKVDSLWLTQL